MLDAMIMRTLPALAMGLLLPAWSAAAASASPPKNHLEVPSLHLEAELESVPCDAFSGPSLPSADEGLLSDCSARGFYGIVGRQDGRLEPLSSAPAGTVVHWWDGRGTEFTRTLSASGVKIYRYPDGSWPGHGVPPGMPLYIAVRDKDTEIERPAVE